MQETNEVEVQLRRKGGIDAALERLLKSERAARRRVELRDAVRDDEIAEVRARTSTCRWSNNSPPGTRFVSAIGSVLIRHAPGSTQ